MPNICDNDVHANGGPHAGKCLCGGNVFHPSGARRSAHAYAWHYELCNPTDSQPHSRACDALATMFGEPGPRPCVAIGSVPVPGQEEGKVPASSPQAAHQEKAREPVCRGQERERKIIVDYLRERFAIELADDVEHGEHVLAIKAEAIERDADLESDGGLRYCKPR